MKFAIALLVVFAGSAAGSSETLTKVDGYEPYQILLDSKLFQIYYNCIMDKGTCTTDGQTIKDDIAEHVSTACAECSLQRKALAMLVVRFMIAFRGSEYEEFEKKYDPNHNLRKLYA